MAAIALGNGQNNVDIEPVALHKWRLSISKRVATYFGVIKSLYLVT